MVCPVFGPKSDVFCLCAECQVDPAGGEALLVGGGAPHQHHLAADATHL